MLLPTHIAAGFLLGDFLAGAASRSGQSATIAKRTLLTTIVFSVLPDLDIVWFTLRHHSVPWGDAAGAHHRYITHLPIFYLGLALVAFIVSRRFPAVSPWLITAGLVGSLGHLILDSFLIGWGIMWLYPFSHELVGWNVVTYKYRSAWGDQWLLHYLRSPYSLVEYGLIAVAIGRAIAMRKSALFKNSGMSPKGISGEVIPNRLRRRGI